MKCNHCDCDAVRYFLSKGGFFLSLMCACPEHAKKIDDRIKTWEGRYDDMYDEVTEAEAEVALVHDARLWPSHKEPRND